MADLRMVKDGLRDAAVNEPLLLHTSLPARDRDAPLAKLIQQRLRINQVAGTESFSEPSVDRCEQVVGFLPLAAVGP